LAMELVGGRAKVKPGETLFQTWTKEIKKKRKLRVMVGKKKRGSGSHQKGGGRHTPKDKQH